MRLCGHGNVACSHLRHAARAAVVLVSALDAPSSTCHCLGFRVFSVLCLGLV
jgi:hypothetical protein